MRSVILSAVIMGLFFTINVQAESTKLSTAGVGKAYFPEPVYTFTGVFENCGLSHDFIIGNKGDAPLKITRVKTGCGCVAASYPDVVPPGAEGKININVKTNGYGGRMLRKSVEVKTDDPEHPSTRLVITGKVEEFAHISPKYVQLKGSKDKEVKMLVKVMPRDGYPFKIIGVNSRNTGNIHCALSRNSDDGYIVTVENIKKEKARYSDSLLIKTDSEINPEIQIRVRGNISD